MTSLPRFHRLQASIARRVAPRWERVLFSLTGGAGAWPGMGHYLYRHEAAFRDSVDETSAVVEELLGWSPARSFRGEEPEAATPVESRRRRVIRVGILQIAQIDLWRPEGIEPGGVLCVSMGEMVAPYAAGAFTRGDCARVVGVIAHSVVRRRVPGQIFVLDASPAEAARLCRAAPARLELLGTMHPSSSMVLCGVEDAESVRAFLPVPIRREMPTDWNFHSPRMDMDRDWLDEQLRGVRALPLRCPVYSASAGGRLPTGAPFDARFFAWVANRGYDFGSAATAALDDGFSTVISMGANPETRSHVESCAASRGHSVRFIDSMREGEERSTWKEALTASRALRGLRPSSPPPALARTVDLDDPAVQARLPEVYEELRRAGAVHFIERNGYWLLLNHAEVLAALADAGSFSSRVPSVEETDAEMLGNDAPAHTAIRRTLARHFAAPELARRLELATRVAGELLQPLVEGHTLDVVSEFARPFAQRLGADVLGVDAEAATALGEAGAGGFDAALDALLPRSTTYAWLRDPAGVALDHEPARSLTRLLWVAGTDTLQRSLAAGIFLLLRNDEARAHVEAHPELMERFVDEVLRLGPAEQQLARVTTRDVEVAGVTIPAGALVRLSLSSANRDPARFPDPEAIRFDRPAGAHLAFGGGVHRCLGAAQARPHLAAALRVLLRLAPDFRAVQPLETVRPVPGAPLSGIEQLVIHRGDA